MTRASGAHDGATTCSDMTIFLALAPMSVHESASVMAVVIDGA